jgi:Concanavalin A-like lectin/glucanases superfamily
MPENVLNLWRFDNSTWRLTPSQAPLLFHNVGWAESWSGYAAAMAGWDSAQLVFPAIGSAGHVNLNPTAGTLRFWFCPYWSSAGMGGQGMGGPARLLEIGAWSSQGAVAWWSLQVAPDGRSLAFLAKGGAKEEAVLLVAPLAWQAGEWHQVALTYSAQSSALYLDGVQTAAGPPLALVPLSPGSGTMGMAVGSDVFGANLAQGEFDELTTLDHPQSPAEISLNFTALKERAAMGPISEEEEAQINALMMLGLESALAQKTQKAATETLESVSCPEASLLLERQPDGTLQLSICGGKEGAIYDLFSLDDLNLSHDWAAWNWETEMTAEDQVAVNSTASARFYQVVEVLDPQTIGPVTFYVGPDNLVGADGSRDLPFPNLQAALNSQAVTDGDVIQVLPGVYSGADNCNLDFSGRNLTLVTERGWESTIIDCTGQAHAFIFQDATPRTRGVVIGFTIRNATSGAVSCSNGSRPLFANCAFVQNGSATGGALDCAESVPVFFNCRFSANAATTLGGAIYATGAGARVNLSHCTFSDNSRGNNGGTLNAQNGALIELINSIVWSIYPALGAEIVTGGNGVVIANYCDVRGGFNGTGNLDPDADPLFEANGTLRLTSTSPCIDQGTTQTFPGGRLLVQYDMDGEARLDHASFPNTYSTTDIGADEFVYRLAFPLVDGNDSPCPSCPYSQVDEASGVAYLGSITVGNEQHAKFAIVDDELKDKLYICELNAAGDDFAYFNGVPQVNPVNIAHPNPPGSSGLLNADINDLEGVTFDHNNRYLYIITSQTKRNRYRDVDNLSNDPLVDPPSSDYDRRRTIIMRIDLDNDFNPIPDPNLNGEPMRTVWESDSLDIPSNTDVDDDEHDGMNPRVNHGLIAYIRDQLRALGAPYTPIDLGNNVLLAWSYVNKFGTPKDGHPYASGERLPYLDGGPDDPGGDPATAGTVLDLTSQEIQNGRKTLQNWAFGNTPYYFKIWAIDSSGDYHEGPVATCFTDGRPRLFINEFLAVSSPSGDDCVEVYNPADVSLDMGNVPGGFGQLQIRINAGSFSIPAGTTIPALGFLRFIRGNNPNPANEFSFGSSFNLSGGQGGDGIYLERPGDPMPIDDYVYTRNQHANISEGRAWDAGPRHKNSMGVCEGAQFNTGSTYPPTALRTVGPPAPNQVPAAKHFFATPDPNQTTIYLQWAAIGVTPGVWAYSPKQHDFHPINIEGIAYRSPTEMMIGLRSPLSVDRRTGNALYFKVTNVRTPPNEFLPDGGGWPGSVSGISGPLQLNLESLGIRAIEWYPQLAGGRYLIIGGPANGGPLEKETFGEKFSLFAWDGSPGTGNVATPQKLIDDLSPYSTRPEGVDLIQIDGQWRVIFVEDRYRATGYGTRNAAHWPVSILGTVE